MTVLIHRPVEIVAFAVEGENDLIHVPRISGWGWRHRYSESC
jgi:hypothetical protein